MTLPDAPPSASPSSSARRFALLVFLGLLFLQSSWIAAVPPMGAIDEFDHVYRAAGVAGGQWILEEEVPNARGSAVAVPPGLVRVAEKRCEALTYAGDGNCHPVETLPDGRVIVATAAGHYSPLYYALIGFPAAPFDGVAAVYVMRLVSALVCALVLACAAYCLALTSAGVWTRLGFIAALTPTLMYASVIPAPNSIEMVFALLMWCSALAAIRGVSAGKVEGSLLLLGGGAAMLVALSRQLGPLWVAIISLVLMVFAGRSRIRTLVRRNPWASGLGGAVLLTGTTLSIGWTLWSGFLLQSGDVSAASSEPGEVAWNPTWLVAWSLQIIGAFPFRNNPAPMAVYAFYLLALIPLVVAAICRARSGRRIAILSVVLLSQAIPLLLTAVSASSQGVIWQGRYQLPVVVGLTLMSGMVLDSRPPRFRTRDLVRVFAALMLGAQVYSVVAVAVAEKSGQGLPVYAIGVLATAGGLLLLVSPLLYAQRRVLPGLTPVTRLDRDSRGAG